MTVIWKIALKPIDEQEIEVPIGSDFLCAREQGNEICVWFRCDPDEPNETHKVAIVGTGHPAPESWKTRYLGMAMIHGGELVFHVFLKT